MKTIAEELPKDGQLCRVVTENSAEFTAIFNRSLFDATMWNFGRGVSRTVMLNDRWEPAIQLTEKAASLGQNGCNDYGLTKYDRPIKGAKQGTIDVYAVIETFNVTCPARQHALKKLLCSGIRGKGDALQDLKETRVAIDRAIALQEERNAS